MEGRGMRSATPAQVALGPDFTIGWDSHAADFAMTLGEFYCKGLLAPVMVEIKRDDVVFARVYDIRGRSISSLLAIRHRETDTASLWHNCHTAPALLPTRAG